MAYTNIDDPSAYFQTAIYTGNGGSDRAIVNDGNSAMQPDWVWYKSRSNATSNILYDSSRGADYYLKSNTTGAEGSDAQMFESFDSDGFSLNGDTDGNGNGRTYVAWQWKANGGTNQGSNYQVNTTSGFSIGTYTGNRASVVTANHGLGAKLDFLLIKSRSAAGSWVAWHKSDPTKVMFLDATDAAFGYGTYFDAAPNANTSSFSVGDAGATNAAGVTYLFYGFAEKQGYSKFGKYVGNGNADGSFVYTGFKPAFVMLKDVTQATNWEMFDHKRNPSNVANLKLGANLSVAENGSDLGNTSQNNIDMLSNGFKMRTGNTDTNVSGDTYIYMAFAENPFTTSTGVPTTAR